MTTFMKIKVSEASGTILDYMVAKARGFDVYYNENLNGIVMDGFWVSGYYPGDLNSWIHLRELSPSTNWAQGGPLIDREGISVIRFEDDYTFDVNGFATSESVPVWGAYIGWNSFDEVYGSQGDEWGQAILFDPNCVVYSHAPLVAAMRCLVASVLGDEVDVPDELYSQ
jgi:hypothetical protein